MYQSIIVYVHVTDNRHRGGITSCKHISKNPYNCNAYASVTVRAKIIECPIQWFYFDTPFKKDCVLFWHTLTRLCLQICLRRVKVPKHISLLGDVCGYASGGNKYKVFAFKHKQRNNEHCQTICIQCDTHSMSCYEVSCEILNGVFNQFSMNRCHVTVCALATCVYVCVCASVCVCVCARETTNTVRKCSYNTFMLACIFDNNQWTIMLMGNLATNSHVLELHTSRCTRQSFSWQRMLQ